MRVPSAEAVKSPAPKTVSCFSPALSWQVNVHSVAPASPPPSSSQRRREALHLAEGRLQHTLWIAAA